MPISLDGKIHPQLHNQWMYENKEPGLSASKLFISPFVFPTVSNRQPGM